MNKRTRAATESLGFLAITAAIFVALNALSVFGSCRLDWTENQRYSLSRSSTQLASSLTDKLVITAYFTEDLPPPFNRTEQDVRDLLSEYENASGGHVEVRFVSPNTDAEKEAAQEAGVSLVDHFAIEDDGRRAVKGFRGLVMEYLERKEVIPVIKDGTGLEYDITTKIKQMAGEKTPVGILSGHDGPSLSQGLGRLRQCLPTYNLIEVPATDELTTENVSALLVIEPHTALSQSELEHMNRFVLAGGGLGVFAPNLKVEIPQQQQGPMPSPPSISENDTGLDALLRPWGMVPGSGAVLDWRAFDQWPMQARLGGQMLRLPTVHPPVLRVFFDDEQSEHPVAFRLNQGFFPFNTPIELTSEAPEGVVVTVVASSSEDSWLGQSTDFTFEGKPDRAWIPSFRGASTTGPQPIAVAAEGRLPSAFGGEDQSNGESSESEADQSEREGRVLVVGGSFFLYDMWTQNYPDCRGGGELAFAMNAVDWLAQDSDLIAIRAKSVEDPQIDVPETISRSEEAARSAAEAANEAAAEAMIAEATGNEEAMEKASQTRETAEQQERQALDERERALADWNSRKKAYRFGNMLGMPLLFALFGLLWWQYRRNANQNIKL